MSGLIFELAQHACVVAGERSNERWCERERAQALQTEQQPQGRALPMLARVRVRQGGQRPAPGGQRHVKGSHAPDQAPAVDAAGTIRQAHACSTARRSSAATRSLTPSRQRDPPRTRGRGSTLVLDRLTGTKRRPATRCPPGQRRAIGERRAHVLAVSRGRERGPLPSAHRRGSAGRPVGEDLNPRDTRVLPSAALLDAAGVAYRIRVISRDGSFPELRWTSSTCAGQDERGEPTSLREVVARLQDYEPATAIARVTIAANRGSRHLSTSCLRAELERLSTSPIVLNRRLRELVAQRVSRDGPTMSEIAIRCGAGQARQPRQRQRVRRAGWLAVSANSPREARASRRRGSAALCSR